MRRGQDKVSMVHDTSRRGSSSWRATLIAVCIAQATAIIGFDFTLPFIPLYLQHNLGVHGLGQTALWAGLIGFGPAIPATICGPLWGRLADRIGYRLMLIRAMICAGVLLALMGLAPNPGILLVLRMAQGALSGTVFSSQALVAASAPEKETGRAMGLLQMSVYFGATIGPVGGGLVAELAGYRAAFVAAGLLIAAATLVVFLFVHEPAQRPAQVARAEGRQPSIMSVLAIPAFAAALGLTLIVQLASTALFPIIPLFVQELLRSTHNVATATGWVMASSGVAAALGSYLAGRLQRRLGLKPLLLGCVVLSAALIVPQAFSHNYVTFLLLRSAGSFAFGALFGLVGIWAALSSPREAKGTAFGLMGAASSMGYGAGPLIGGMVTAAAGIRPVFFLSAGLIALVPLGLLLSSVVLPALSSSGKRLHPATEREH